MVSEQTYILTLAKHELDMICTALYEYQAAQRGWNDKQAELAGALRQVLNRATVQVYWEQARLFPGLTLPPEST